MGYRPPALRGEGGQYGGAPDKICNDFKRGSCTMGAQCHFLHIQLATATEQEVPLDNMGRHCEVAAHTAAITGIAMTEQGIYTTSTDKKLKRWKPQKDATNRFQLIPDLEVPLDD